MTAAMSSVLSIDLCVLLLYVLLAVVAVRLVNLMLSIAGGG